MERVFSVDDILGTFWKLDTQGENGQSNQMGHFGSQLDLQKFYREQASAGATGTAPGGMVHSSSFHRMNRSSSEWAFQEFLKEHITPTGKGAHEAREERAKDGNDSDCQNSDSSGEGLGRRGRIKSGKDDNGKNYQEVGHQGGFVAPSDGGYQAESRGEVSPKEKASQKEETDSLNPSGLGLNQGSSLPSSEVENLNQPFLGQGAVPDPQEYEILLKQQLAAACAMAKTRVSRFSKLILFCGTKV